MKIISGMTVDLIRSGEYGGNDEFIGTYKISVNHPIPFRIIRIKQTEVFIFQPELKPTPPGLLELIKTKIEKQPIL